MKQYYESEVLFQLMERDGFNIPSSVPPYEAEIKDYLINQVKQAYPKLTDYEAEWLLYNYTKHLPAEFPISSVTDVTEASFENVVPFAYQSAILKGNSKYRDIDTGEVLDAFEDGRNLELVSVKMPVLTTSNEDGTKTNILTVNEAVTLRGIGDVKDTLDCLTGEKVERIGEIVLDGSLRAEGMYKPVGKTNGFYFPLNTIQLKSIDDEDVPKIVICDKFRVTNNECQWLDIGWIDEEFLSATLDGRIAIRLLTTKASTIDELHQYLSQNPITVYYQLATESVKTVDLTTVNEKGETTYFIPLEGTMNVQSSGEIIQPTFDMTVPVEATTQNLASFIDLEMRNNHE